MTGSVSARRRVVVVADSLAFVGPRLAHPTDHPALWPNVMGRALDVDVEVFGGYAWTARHGWYALGHDPRLWTALGGADAVVLALGQFDTVPAPLPNFLWKAIPMIRSPRRRRWARGIHGRAVPLLSRIFAHLPGGGPVSLRPAHTVHYLRRSVRLVRHRCGRVPVLGMTPITARPKIFGGVHAGHVAADRAMRAWGAEDGIPLLDFAEVAGPHILSEQAHPDGMHMGWEGHALTGEAMAKLLGELLDEHRVDRPVYSMRDRRRAAP